MDKEKLEALDRAYSPAAPIVAKELFAGRFDQLEGTCDAINERGQHFVLYGERGVGKTSLANIVNSKLLNVVTSKVTCNRSEDFRQVWSNALAKIRFDYQFDKVAGFIPQKVREAIQLDLFLPQSHDINSIDLQSVFERVPTNLLFIFDEFDSISDVNFKAKFADTIKALSDNAPHVTIGIVGIAASVDELLGSHPSIERCLKQILMPRMSKDELHSIIEKGLAIVGIDIDPDVASKIVDLSSGFPHYTHLLMKFASRHCILEEMKLVAQIHYERAIGDAILNTSESIRNAYQKATIASKSKSKFEDVVAACALAQEDEFGTFATRDVVEPYYRVTGETVRPQSLTYNMQRLCEPERGCMLTKVGESKNIRYSFANPLMKVFVKLKLNQRGSYSQPNLFVS